MFILKNALTYFCLSVLNAASQLTLFNAWLIIDVHVRSWLYVLAQCASGHAKL